MRDQDIGDLNVERLLGSAYKPEPVDAAFAAEVTGAMCAAARASASSTDEDAKLLVLRKRLGWAMGLAASVAACFLAYYAHTQRTESVRPQSVHTREIIESIDKIRPATLGDDTRALGLTARPRPEMPPAQLVEVGAVLVTKAGERRRVTLTDGSVLYLNQNTTVKHLANRQLALSAGEVYLEVAPQEPQSGTTFRVTTPKRTVTALGTRFGVQASDQGTGVVVTQGKVKVSGVDDEMGAGQQLVPGQHTIAVAPRVTHVLDWTRELMAAAASPLVPCSKHAGGALIALDPFGQEVTLTLRKFHVDVHIEDGFARTTIDQTYFNNNTWRMEGTFYFPLPPDASLSRLAMYVEDGDASRLMEGGMAERDYAREVFETIMHQRRDPALLEWVDGSTFKMRVFPLEGRKEKRILLSYTQRLSALYGTAHYRFPAGHNMELVRDWSFEARVKHGAPLRVTSASHPEMSFTADGADMLARAAARLVKPDRDVTLEIKDAAAGAPATFTTFEHEKQHYLMVKYRPELAEKPRRERRDWVILFETAANRDPLLARAQVEVVKNLLENVEHDDTLLVLTANTRTHLGTAQPCPATTGNIEAAVKFLEESHLIGALDLGGALAAARPFLDAAKNPYLVHVGAGIAAMGERKEDVLARQVPQNVRYVGIGVGKRWSRAFMKMAADRTGGYFTQINPDEPIAWRTFELLATLNTPRLMDVRVVDAAEQARFLCETTSLAQGEELCAFTRNDGRMPEKVIVSGTLNGQPFTRTLDVQKVVTGAGYLPRTWAKLEIDRLLADGAEKNKKAIVALSLGMYVMTPYTSLLVLETDQDYVTYKVDRGRKDHWAMYQSPPRIATVYEPDPNQQAWRGWQAPAPADKKKTTEEVLASILVRTSPNLWVIPGRPQQPLVMTALDLFQMDAVLEEDRRVMRGDIEVEGLELERWTDNTRPNADLGMPGGGGVDILDRLTDRLAALPAPGGFGGSGRGGLIAGGGGSALGRPGKMLTLFKRGMVVARQETVERRQLRWNLEEEDRLERRLVEFEDGARPLMLRERLGEETFGRREFFPPSLAIIVQGGGRIHTSITGGILGGKEARLEARLKGLAAFPGQRLDFGRKAQSAKGTANIHDGWLDVLAMRLQNERGQRNLLYQRPQVQADSRFFGDLTAFAPGLHTSLADIYAAVEAEATAEKPALPGMIDPGARKLIDRARAAGWQTLTVPGHAKAPGFTVTFDGAGRFAYERVYDTGLHEKVIGDGTTLWSLYPDIGLGGRRPFSRFHHEEFAELLPWLLPRAEELAVGADLRLVNGATVAIVSRQLAAKDNTGKPLPTSQLHLVFAADGRLSERRIVEVPGNKTLVRQTFAPDGTVTILEGTDSKVLGESKLKLGKGSAPKLQPDTRDLLVMELPLRTASYLYSQVPGWNGSFAQLDAGLVERLFVANALGNNNWALQAFGERFHSKGDRRLGFYTLINLANITMARDGRHTWHNAVARTETTFAIEKEHPNSALAAYLAHYQRSLTQAEPAFGTLPGPTQGFIQQLAQFRDLWMLWTGKQPGWDRPEERARALKFIQESTAPLYAWAILDAVTLRARPLPAAFHDAMLKVHKDLGEQVGLTYFVRYEQARSLQLANKNVEASTAFRALYTDTLEAGALPPIDAGFIETLNVQARDGNHPFADFVRERLGDLLKDKRYYSATLLAWQAWQLGQHGLADELFNRVLAGAPAHAKSAVHLCGIEYLWRTGQVARADVLLHQVLADPNYAGRAGAWRLSATLAQRRGLLAKAATSMEKALELDYRALPEIINLNTVRGDYRGLLSHYQQLAMAMTMLESGVPKDFLARVIRAADRWRSLDPDNAEVCQLTSRILQVLGAKDLAWDYVTTPIGLKPNEAAPWLGLANTLRQDAEFELADRALAMAYDAEPTNADILWQRAQNLQQLGKLDQARTLYQQLANGSWQPRFQGIQQQARWYLTNR